MKFKLNLRDKKGLIYITYLIIGINLFIYLLQVSLSKSFTMIFALQPLGSELYSIFQYLTACFLHGSLTHLIFNMLGLLFFGVFIEEHFGRYRFLLLYLLSGVLPNIIWHIVYDPSMPALGASGAIYGLLTSLAIFRPNQIVYIFLILPAKMWIAISLILGYELYMVIFPSQGDNIGHFVHVIGAVTGVMCYILFIRKYKK